MQTVLLSLRYTHLTMPVDIAGWNFAFFAFLYVQSRSISTNFFKK